MTATDPERADAGSQTPSTQATASAHRSVVRMRAELAALGATGEIRVLPDSARTAAEAAAALGCEVGAIASSLVFAADHGLAPLRRASPDFVRTHTGQAIGGVAPVGHPSPVRTFVDRWLSRHETVWAAGGHPHAVFPTTCDELVRMTGGTLTDVAS